MKFFVSYLSAKCFKYCFNSFLSIVVFLFRFLFRTQISFFITEMVQYLFYCCLMRHQPSINSFPLFFCWICQLTCRTSAPVESVCQPLKKHCVVPETCQRQEQPGVLAAVVLVSFYGTVRTKNFSCYYSISTLQYITIFL